MNKGVIRLMVPAVLAGMLALPVTGTAADEAGSTPQTSGQAGQPGYGMPYGMGPGMMGGSGYGGGPGRSGGYGYGMPYGMGPGMMGGYGYGMGPGMMGGSGYGGGPGRPGGYGYGMPYGMGPGMMGGYGTGAGGGYGMPYGMGPGMMEGYGYGMGPGMMGPYAAEALRLNAQQRREIGQIEQGVANKNWKLLGKLRREREKLYELYGKPQLDKSAISDAYRQIAALRKEMFENRLDAQQRMHGVLNSQQQGAWRSMHRGMGYGMMPGYGYQPE